MLGFKVLEKMSQVFWKVTMMRIPRTRVSRLEDMVHVRLVINTIVGFAQIRGVHMRNGMTWWV